MPVAEVNREILPLIKPKPMAIRFINENEEKEKEKIGGVFFFHHYVLWKLKKKKIQKIQNINFLSKNL